jgi:3-deoxy-D-manno-octulosonic-acid transferase
VSYLAYNLLLLLFLPVGLVALSWRLLVRPEYREAVAERFAAFDASPEGQRVVWLHAVSVGEVISATPLVAALRERYPDDHIVVSCGTPTGRAMARTRCKEADRVVYLPYDYPLLAAAAVRRLRPALFLLLESELWPNLLRCLSRHSTPVILVNGRISRRSFPRYLRVRPLYARALSGIRRFLMQTKRDADHVRRMGAPADRIEVVGNIKYDQPVVDYPAEELQRLRRDLGLTEDAPVLLAGSTHADEEIVLARVWQTLAAEVPGLVLVLAVRHPERAPEVVAALARMGIQAGRKTRDDGAGKGVILLDTIGELAAHYRLATVAFVGGSLVPVGGHNPLEPAGAGVPVVYGPHVRNFDGPCAALEAAAAAVRVKGEADLAPALRRLFADPTTRKAMGEAGAAVVRENGGAVAHTVACIEEVLG